VFPGVRLIDTHCHLEDWAAPMFISYGITTVRDTGNELNWILAKKEEMERPEALGPSILCCGPVLDGMPYFHPVISWGIKKDEDMLLAIEYLKSRKVDAIKLYVGLDLKKVEIAVEECARRGLHLLGHFQGNVELIDAIRAGVAEVEHFAGVPSFYSEEIIQEIIKKGAWAVPTQMVFEGLNFYINNKNEMQKDMDYIPTGIFKDYLREFYDVTTKNDPGFLISNAFFKNNREYIKGMIRLGGKIASGTDAPCQFAFPGRSLFYELQVFSECGMSNSDILKCATANAAELLGIDARTGTIGKGKKADMLIVEGDPLKELSELRSIKCVYKKGYKHLSDEVLEKANPAAMPTNHLPNISELATEFSDWKEKYLSF